MPRKRKKHRKHRQNNLLYHRLMPQNPSDATIHVRAAAEKSADFLAELRKEYPGKFAYFQCDVSSHEAREALLDAYEAEFGSLDVLVNNAGVAPEVRADVLEMSEESFDRVMNINLKGPFFLTQAAAKRMIHGAQENRLPFRDRS